MKFKVGDLVTRSSYNNDIVFIIISIDGEEAILKGFDVRLIANSPLSDLNICEEEEQRDKFWEEVKEQSFLEKEDRDDFFYLPAKILHLDADISLNNNLTNPYKIREKAKKQNKENHQKKHKMSKI